VNCRILPGHSRADIYSVLVGVLDDAKASVNYISNGQKVPIGDREKIALPPVKLNPAVMDPLEKVSAEMWPGAPVVPTMGTGATDGVYTNPAGHSHVRSMRPGDRCGRRPLARSR
jgi:acetylornithine deacetylase/succinyl-diaminopimelate desuccinylase-like protein